MIRSWKQCAFSNTYKIGKIFIALNVWTDEFLLAIHLVIFKIEKKTNKIIIIVYFEFLQFRRNKWIFNRDQT